MTFRAATWNVLATAYLGKGDYASVPAELLDPDQRVPAVVRHAAGLAADLLCLQEVESDVFAGLLTTLEPMGYAGHLELKGRNKPDGCATFYRTTMFTLREQAVRLEYRDREKGMQGHSGFVALLLAVEHAGRLLGVANTHLRWDRPGTPRDRQIGHRQIKELLEECGSFDPPCAGWLICGDFNCRPQSEVVATLRKAGFEFAHAGRPHIRSAVANGRASLIDYLFHSTALQALAIDPPWVADDTVLPSDQQPSDHLALVAEFAWRDVR
jgi:mRNA deadenylase 3'-5' endonuclease subunit Ccr4